MKQNNSILKYFLNRSERISILSSKIRNRTIYSSLCAKLPFTTPLLFPKINLNKFLLSLFSFILFSCVGPPDPIHGFVENFPVVVNSQSVFSFSVRGVDYSFEEDYELNFSFDSTQTIITTLIVTGYNGNARDTTLTIWLENDSSVVQGEVYNVKGNQELVTEKFIDSVFYLPKIIFFRGDLFNGVLEFVLSLKTNN